MSDPDRPALEGMPPRPERRALLDWLLGLSGAGALLAVFYPVVAAFFLVMLAGLLAFKARRLDRARAAGGA